MMMPESRKRNPRRSTGKGRGGGNPRRRIPTPFPWDKDLPANVSRIDANFAKLRPQVVTAALDGQRPNEALLRDWHRQSVRGVRLAEPEVAGGFRGEGPPGSRLNTSLNAVRGVFGIPMLGADAARVPGLVAGFFMALEQRLDALDARVGAGEGFAAYYRDVLVVCAWAHGEWVRIHPFADHNGSTARLMVIAVGLRYGVPLKLPGKPRNAMPTPGLIADYNLAAGNQMLGDDQLMVTVLHQLASGAAAPTNPPSTGSSTP
jgi:hypothetical protein